MAKCMALKVFCLYENNVIAVLAISQIAADKGEGVHERFISEIRDLPCKC